MAPLNRVLLLLGLVQALGFAPPSGRAVSTRALRGPHTRLCSARGGAEAALADDAEMLRVEEGALLAADGDAGSGGAVVVLGLICLIAAVCSLDRVVMAVAIIPMGAQYGFSDTLKGAISASFSVGYFGGLLPSGLLSTLLSPSRVVGAGLVVFSVAQFVTPMAASTGTLPLLAARAVMGLGEATVIPSLQRLASEWVRARALFASARARARSTASPRAFSSTRTGSGKTTKPLLGLRRFLSVDRLRHGVRFDTASYQHARLAVVVRSVRRFRSRAGRGLACVVRRPPCHVGGRRCEADARRRLRTKRRAPPRSG